MVSEVFGGQGCHPSAGVLRECLILRRVEVFGSSARFTGGRGATFGGCSNCDLLGVPAPFAALIGGKAPARLRQDQRGKGGRG